MWLTQVNSLMTQRPPAHARNMTFFDDEPRCPSPAAHEAAARVHQERRASNEEAIIRALKIKGTLNRKELGNMLNLNAGWVGQLANRMVADGRLTTDVIGRNVYFMPSA